MEYVEGVTLARRLEDGRCRWASRCAPPSRSPTRWTTRIGTAWSTGFKPANVMLTRDSVKLLDFGLAKLKERDEQVPIGATEASG